MDLTDGTVNTAGTDGYLLPIVDSATGRTFGLHQRFTDVRDMYNAGHLTFVANTGALVEPIANNADFGLS